MESKKIQTIFCMQFVCSDQCEKTANGLKSRNTAVHNFQFLTSTCHGEEKSQITPFKWKRCQHMTVGWSDFGKSNKKCRRTETEYVTAAALSM